jgi:hypothetical protein
MDLCADHRAYRKITLLPGRKMADSQGLIWFILMD